MIITLTLSPAIDKSAAVEVLAPGRKLRCEDIVLEPGGGGINVSKALRELGTMARAVFPAGGASGQSLRKLVERRGLSYTAVATGSETRENLTVLEKQTCSQYRFVMPGARLEERETLLCMDAVIEVQPRPDYVVISGSIPPGVSPDLFAKVVGVLKTKCNRLIIDTSGPALLHAAQAGVYLLKPNLSELRSISGQKKLSKEDIIPVARSAIAKKYCEIMVISLGGEGAILVTGDDAMTIAAPEVKVISTVGAGDSMVAGMAWMLAQGKTPAESAAFGVACGTAATMNPGTQLLKKEDALRLYSQLQR